MKKRIFLFFILLIVLLIPIKSYGYITPRIVVGSPIYTGTNSREVETKLLAEGDGYGLAKYINNIAEEANEYFSGNIFIWKYNIIGEDYLKFWDKGYVPMTKPFSEMLPYANSTFRTVLLSSDKQQLDIEYVITDEDITIINQAISENEPAFITTYGLLVGVKLPSNVEAAYAYIEGEVRTSRAVRTFEPAYMQIIIDKKTVEIEQKIGKVEENNTVKTYNADTNIITQLKENQEVEVRLTAKRPVGVLDSGDITIISEIPEGMAYVEDSIGYSTDDGITINSLANIDISNETGKDLNGCKWTFSGLPVGKKVELFYKIKAPNTVDNPITEGIETEREFITSAKLINNYQKNLKYSRTVFGNNNNVYLSNKDTVDVDTYDTNTVNLKMKIKKDNSQIQEKIKDNILDETPKTGRKN